ncbi:hypothetical protein GGC63_005152 [Paenibacillus sp. OAS669]|nr:hypothetical protein [Paenibacillus sp. OAS669]
MILYNSFETLDFIHGKTINKAIYDDSSHSITIVFDDQSYIDIWNFEFFLSNGSIYHFGDFGE